MRLLQLIIWVGMLLTSCRSDDGTVVSRSEKKDVLPEDSLLGYNRILVEEEKQQIEDFLLRYRWNMIMTNTGLHYMIYKNGDGSIPGPEDEVTIIYTIRLLNGEEVYRTEEEKPVSVRLGQRKIPAGLEEGIQLMKVGDKAKMILPSHLAFGLLGDQKKIPGRAILVCDVQLLSTEN